MIRLFISCCAAGLIALLVISGGLISGRVALEPPPPYAYDGDDIQFFAPGPEFKLSREAAGQKAYKADEAARSGAAKSY